MRKIEAEAKKRNDVTGYRIKYDPTNGRVVITKLKEEVVSRRYVE